MIIRTVAKSKTFSSLRQRLKVEAFDQPVLVVENEGFLES